jgi:gas vesicle protein
MGKGTKFAVTTVVAAGVGYVAGVLTAPKSGKETRRDIHDKAVETKEELAKKLDEVSTDLGEVIEKGKTRVKNLEAGAKTELEKAVNTAVLAKDKARDMVAAVKRGEAEDKDLKKAVKDVHSAIDNLKKYIQKNG